MPKPDLLERVRRIALALPHTEESSRLGGSPHFYVHGKIFTGAGVEDGRWSFGAKVGLERQAILVTRPGIRVAKYVGRYGWISVDEAALADEAELRALIELSYELVAARLPAAKRIRKKVDKKKAKK
ncbi:MAG: MmcQ/YjbR family DNA-binding protein [Planctomycetes bacterium]|nr:MmcQ/YjbR family DNA-binding protein [Planctomycetota bacterium]